MTDEEQKERKRLSGLARNAKWRASHKEHERDRKKRYRESDLAKSAAREKASYERNRGNRRVYGAAYRDAHRAEMNAKARAYRLEHQAEERAKDKADRIANLERVRQSKAKYRAKRPEKERESKRRWNERTKAARKVKHLAWARANAGIVNAAAMRYWAAKLKATPAWADHDTINAVYIEAARITRDSGIRYDVDHIIPLQSPHVCGLHVACNLQILTKVENIRKRNRFTPHISQPE